MTHTNAAYEEEKPPVGPAIEAKLDTPRRYYYFHDLSLATADLMNRDTFEHYVTTTVESGSKELIELMLKEYDDRKNPVKDDTVVS